MLGRSANNIFWMARYLERAENTARLLDVGFRLALTRGADAARVEWRSVLVTIGQEEDFARSHSGFVPAQVFNFILRDKDNPSSVLQMIENARTSARAVRTGITREVWEATNECWMELRELLSRPVREANLGQVLAAIRSSTTQVRGAMDGTMLRHEIHNFARIGTFVERADNTARILDVKYWVLLPSVAWVGSQLDNAQWETVLRSVGGERAFRWLNAGTVDARGIAEFLILDERFPRSLMFCYNKISSNMGGLERQYGGALPSHDVVRGIAKRLDEMGTDAIFDGGLHEFIVSFLDSNNRVGEAIAADYRFTQ